MTDLPCCHCRYQARCGIRLLCLLHPDKIQPRDQNGQTEPSSLPLNWQATHRFRHPWFQPHRTDPHTRAMSHRLRSVRQIQHRSDLQWLHSGPHPHHRDAYIWLCWTSSSGCFLQHTGAGQSSVLPHCSRQTCQQGCLRQKCHWLLNVLLWPDRHYSAYPSLLGKLLTVMCYRTILHCILQRPVHQCVSCLDAHR